MDDEDLERMVADLRAMLVENGFGWAAEQAEQGLPPEASMRSVALALIQATESVTVDLAQAELAALEGLGVEDIDFKPPPEEATEADAPRARTIIPEAGADRLRGPSRRKVLEDLANRRAIFDELRENLDGVN